MNIVVKLFAGARDIVGKNEVALEFESPITIGELRTRLIDQHPALQPLLPYAMFAIETTYCDDATPIPKNATVACIPPVSGG